MSSTDPSIYLTTNTSSPSYPFAIDNHDCTLATCPLIEAHFTYVPTLAGNALFAGLFGLMLILQLGLGIRYKTWGFMVGAVSGLLLEIIGYVARVQMSSNPFTKSPFLMYLVCLTIAPAFLTAAVYLCLARIIVVFGEHLSRFRPRTYTITFMTCDFISLLLQAAGGAMTSSANTGPDEQTGINIMIAGLAFQVVSLVVFIVLTSEFAWRVISRTTALDENFRVLRESKMFKLFLGGLFVATFTIFIRSAFRVAELSQGFHGVLANQQVTFMILEGVMIILACICLTAFHPGTSFKGMWAAADFKLGHQEGRAQEKENSSIDVGNERGAMRD